MSSCKHLYREKTKSFNKNGGAESILKVEGLKATKDSRDLSSTMLIHIDNKTSMKFSKVETSNGFFSSLIKSPPDGARKQKTMKQSFKTPSTKPGSAVFKSTNSLIKTELRKSDG
jgi:hypothetical protein